MTKAMQFKQIKLLILGASFMAHSARGFGENPETIGSRAHCIARDIRDRNSQIIALSNRFSNFINVDDSDVFIELVFVLNMMAGEDPRKFVTQLLADLYILNKTIKEVAEYNQFADTLYGLVQTKKGISKVLKELDSVVIKNYLAYLEIESKYASRLLTTQDGIKAVKQMILHKYEIVIMCEYYGVSKWLDKHLAEVKQDCAILDKIYSQIPTAKHGIKNKMLGLLEHLRVQKEALG